MELRLHRYELKLRHEFRISRDAHTVQPTLIAELIKDGQHGYGEATSNSYYGATLDAMEQALNKLRPLLATADWENPADLWQQVAEPLASNPFPLCALDQACHDLWGKLHNQPVYRLWNLDTSRCPVSNYTIGIDSLDRMIQKLREMPAWPIYKIKLGTDHDLDIVRELRQHTRATFRVDANCGWTLGQALELAPALKELNVQFIEQPLPADRLDDYQVLFQESPGHGVRLLSVND